MIEGILAVAPLVLACLIALSRDEAELVKIWSRLVSPEAAGLRASLDVQVKAKEFVFKARRGAAAKTARSKDKAEATRLNALAAEAKREYRTLREVQRMLSAVR